MAVSLAFYCTIVTKCHCRLSSRHFMTSPMKPAGVLKEYLYGRLHNFQLGPFSNSHITNLSSSCKSSTMAPQPKYKLTYFPIKGLGEPIRLILSYARANFEDCRFEIEDWPTKVKPTMPFGKVPVLEVDGKAVHQSIAIARYLGSQYGLGGGDDWQNLEIDSLVETMMDLRTQLADMFFDKDKQSKALKKEPLKEVVPFYLGKFDETVKRNGGFLVGNKMTWADLYWVGVLDYFGVMAGFRSGAELIEGYRNLKEHEERILAIPSIRAWVEKRPKTSM